MGLGPDQSAIQRAQGRPFTVAGLLSWNRDCRLFNKRQNVFRRGFGAFEKVHAVYRDLNAALVVAGRQAALLQIPNRGTDLLGGCLHNELQVAHREAGRGGLGTTAIAEHAQDSGSQTSIAAEGIEELVATELGTAFLLADAFQLVEYAPQFGVRQTLVSSI